MPSDFNIPASMPSWNEQVTARPQAGLLSQQEALHRERVAQLEAARAAAAELPAGSFSYERLSDLIPPVQNLIQQPQHIGGRTTSFIGGPPPIDKQMTLTKRFPPQVGADSYEHRMGVTQQPGLLVDQSNNAGLVGRPQPMPQPTLADYARLEPEPTDTNLTSGMEHSDFFKQMQDYEKLSGGQQTHSSVSPQPASQPTKTQPPKVGWPEFDVEYITGKNGKPARSGATLDSLHPYMKEKMERIRDLAFDKHGLKMIFISGHRNEAQQKKKFDSRTSKAKFGGSSHSYGHGVDFYFQGDAEAMYRKHRRMKDDDGKWTGKLLPYNKAGEGELTKFTDPEDFQKVATIAAGEGLEWGGSKGVGTAGDFGHLGPVGFSGYGKAAQQQMQSPGMDKQLYSQIMSEQMIADDQDRIAKDLGFPPAK